MTVKKLSPSEKAHWEATSKGHGDARDSLSTCPLMGQKVQLLPLRYGRVERLTSPTDTEAYANLKRPVGLRLLREGYLYVIDETSGYLHEYRIQNGLPVKLLWQDSEVAQDVRQSYTGETALIFPRTSVLYVAYAELQWTAAKCSHVLSSAEDRQYFMQRVSLAEADCQTGGTHLRVEEQIRAQLAELAEEPAPRCVTPDIPEQEQQDYIWEDETLFREAHIGELKSGLNPYYEQNHLYLVVHDSIGIMRDLAQEQDQVVTWIEQWRNRTDNDLRYSTASYIDTLIKVGDHTARSADGKSKLVEKTTPEQRERIYDYVDARNDWLRERNQGPARTHPTPGHPAPLLSDHYQPNASIQAAKGEMNRRKAEMIKALEEPLYDELEDDIEALEQRSKGVLQGVGLGSRGINDLIRFDEMQQYLSQERTHLKRWTERLDAITADRISLFEQGEFHRSAWYFDPQHPEQLKNALAMEFNCTRDMGRTEACMERMGEYFHNNPHFILPVFYGRLNLSFLLSKSGDLVNWLDSFKNWPNALADADLRVTEVTRVMDNHWTNSLNLDPDARVMHQAVLATYNPANALRMERWLEKMHRLLNTPQLQSHLETFSRFTNRGQRLGMLAALKTEGATLSIANRQDINNFYANFARFNQLLADEDRLIRDRDRLARQLRKRGLSPQQHQDLIYDRQTLNRQLLAVRNERSAVGRRLEAAITPTSSSTAGYIGVKLNLSPRQQAAFDDEIGRFKAGVWKGYDTPGTGKAAALGGMIPFLAAILMASNLGDAYSAFKQTSNREPIKQTFILVGALAAVISAALSAYQTGHIAGIDVVLQALTRNPQTTGRLFVIRRGKLALGLGVFISPLAMAGAIGTSWNNWDKWQDAFLRGTAGEKSGALLGLIGDTGTLGISTIQTSAAGREFIGLIREVFAAQPALRPVVANNA